MFFEAFILQCKGNPTLPILYLLPLPFPGNLLRPLASGIHLDMLISIVASTAFFFIVLLC